MNATTIDKAIIIMEDYLPKLWNSSNYRFNILDVICGNTNWTKEMVRFVETHETQGYYREMIIQTLMHDIGGLMSSDEHFLPRI